MPYKPMFKLWVRNNVWTDGGWLADDEELSLAEEAAAGEFTIDRANEVMNYIKQHVDASSKFHIVAV